VIAYFLGGPADLTKKVIPEPHSRYEIPYVDDLTASNWIKGYTPDPPPMQLAVYRRMGHSYFRNPVEFVVYEFEKTETRS
jgi:hypothetical protein